MTARAWPALAALACGLVMAAITVAATRDVLWTADFADEVWPAAQGLLAGDVAAAWARSPGYAAWAVLVAAPAALIADALGGGLTATARLVAVPGAVALAWLLAVLARAPGAATPGRRLVVVLAAAAPIAYQAVLFGHTEDLLAGAAAAGAVLAALRGRTTTAALLVVVAVLAKQWGVLALGPVLLAAPHGRLRLAALAGGGAVAVLGAELLLHPVARAASTVPTASGDFFHPHQVWWPFGVEAPPAWTAAGHGTRISPPWLLGVPKPLIVLSAFALSAAWALRPGRDARDALALLALAFALRCVLDPWNLVYYHLPLVLALAAWELVALRRLPVLALAAGTFTWLSFVTYPARDGIGPFVVYLAWMLPLVALLAGRLWGRPRSLSLAVPWPSTSSPPGSPTAPA